MGRRAAQHHGIQGSAALATQPISPVPAEALAPGEMRRLPFAGELLGAARVRSGFVAVPLDAFDEAAPGLAPEEQAAYLHLIRLSYGEGRNWCRVPKRALEQRLNASERRLLRMLDGLVRRGLARPLHRDNRGTLWRVYLPREAAGEVVGDEVLLGRVSHARPSDVRPSQVRPSTAALDLAPAPAPPSARPARAAPADGPLARALAEARGALDAPGLAQAARDVADLLAEGQSPRRIRAAIEALQRRGPLDALQRRTPSSGSTP
jgi:hypothetical protein